MNGWLTAEQVEHVQWAVQANRPVSSFVNDLRHATLPALLEYGCLRASMGLTAIPPLPAAIAESPLGQSLDEVPSHLGIHNSLKDNKKPSRVDTRTSEFFSILTEEELESKSRTTRQTRGSFTPSDSQDRPRPQGSIRPWPMV